MHFKSRRAALRNESDEASVVRCGCRCLGSWQALARRVIAACKGANDGIKPTRVSPPIESSRSRIDILDD